MLTQWCPAPNVRPLSGSSCRCQRPWSLLLIFRWVVDAHTATCKSPGSFTLLFYLRLKRFREYLSSTFVTGRESEPLKNWFGRSHIAGREWQSPGGRGAVPSSGESRVGGQALAGVGTCVTREKSLCMDNAYFMDLKCVQCLAQSWALT